MDKLREYVEKVQSGKIEGKQIFVALSGAGLFVGEVHKPTEKESKIENSEKDFWLERVFVVMPALLPIVMAQFSYAHVAAWGLAEGIIAGIELSEKHRTVSVRIP